MGELSLSSGLTTSSSFPCLYCNLMSSTLGYLVLHLKTVHPAQCYRCELCGFLAVKKSVLEYHTTVMLKKIHYFMLECDHPL